MLNKKGKMFVKTVITTTTIISLLLTINVVRILKKQVNVDEEKTLGPTLTSRIDYQVCLHDNPFIEEKCLKSNKSYISSLVDYIDVDFSYRYNSKQNVDLEYEYKIIAEIVTKHIVETGKDVNSPIWEKTVVIKEPTPLKALNGIVEIKEEVKINLDYYNQMIESFKSDLNLVVDAGLKVSLIITPKSGPMPQHELSITNSLNVKTFDIFTQTNFNSRDFISGSKQVVSMENEYFVVIINIILIMIVVGIGFKLVISVKKLAKTQYHADIEKILKNYANRIIEVSNFVDYKKAEIIDIIDFSEMLNLADETFEPIMSWEKTPNQEMWFVIFRNNILHRFIIKNSDKKKTD